MEFCRLNHVAAREDHADTIELYKYWLAQAYNTLNDIFLLRIHFAIQALKDVHDDNPTLAQSLDLLKRAQIMIASNDEKGLEALAKEMLSPPRLN